MFPEISQAFLTQDLPLVVASACCIWAFFILIVQCIGITQLFRFYSAPPPKAISPTLKKDEIPHVTIIRPVKGLEAGLYECLASTFQQDYPRDKLALHLCVASVDDPAFPLLQQIVADFPGFDARVFVEEEDPLLHGTDGHVANLGPNPKIRNMSRAYREAKGDVMWIVDCNIWVSKSTLGRMVDKLYGFGLDGKKRTPYKFVHQLPLVVDIGSRAASRGETAPLLEVARDAARGAPPSGRFNGGSRLEEMFLATSHAKFYSAINTVSVAPCVVGKSNMFRKSHLDYATDPARNPILSSSSSSPPRPRGIDFFSSNICEDHLIGDLLWRTAFPGFANHGLSLGDMAVQPVAGMSTAAYVGRRVRWLRVRKFTVLLATLVEPGVEAFLCSLYLAFGVTTVPVCRDVLRLSGTWATTAAVWLASVTVWMFADRLLFCRLHKLLSVEADENTPPFARGTGRRGGMTPRSFGPWLLAWLGREGLALPVWTWAVLLGTTVTWRGRQFNVRTDMTVVEIGGQESERRHDSLTQLNGNSTNNRSRSKYRVD